MVNHDVSHLCAQKGMRIDRGECDAEPVIGKGCDEFIVFVDSSVCIECQDRDHLILCFNACFFNHVAEGFAEPSPTGGSGESISITQLSIWSA